MCKINEKPETDKKYEPAPHSLESFVLSDPYLRFFPMRSALWPSATRRSGTHGRHSLRPPSLALGGSPTFSSTVHCCRPSGPSAAVCFTRTSTSAPAHAHASCLAECVGSRWKDGGIGAPRQEVKSTVCKDSTPPAFDTEKETHMQRRIRES
jgi:hypothetical protein